ncbi:tetratricopeptide repeat protein [Neochlamydia sp. S13]|uniref:tetratricopeptide repeat protein n=1 Tax=Neochlamydia sp. S13 TaxID=1353976 RepID=UPI0005AA6053|nr:tetratricopeptide repeat protein [Neochlamydia sp. S13]BBI18266.1 hypothetical protein NCS13_2_0069 [Neochlamydia sp. S13]
MNLPTLSIHPFIFPGFKKIEKRKQPYLKLGPYAEISLEIFKKLGCQDLCQASLVCKEWKRLAEQTNLLKKLYSASFEDGLQEEEQPGDKVQSLDLSSCQWDETQIAVALWQDSTSIISNSIKAKVNAAATYLKEEGFELKGVASDGDCFFSAFLGSYACLSRKIPLLDDCKDKIPYLRQVLADIVRHIGSERAEEIKRKATWVSGLGEGDLLASALSIPIRLVTVNEEHLICGIHDRLIFSEQGLPEGNRSQEWKAIPQKERPNEYIFIVDLGGHFLYAQKHLKRESPLFSKVGDSSNPPLSNSPPKNELKKTLESLGIDDLLPEEEMKDLELSYTQVLKRAVKEKDPIQESLYIERLGDIYLRKENSETLLQAAGLYNYALHKAPKERQEIIRDRLSHVQNLLVRECKGKSLDSAVMRKQLEGNRQALEKLRAGIKAKIQALPETPSSQEVRQIYQEVVQRIKVFFKLIVEQAMATLEPAPCEYAMIGFGSLAREEMTPYSDLEFGILIQEDSKDNRKYFKRLTTLIHLRVINLGETILPALNIPCLKAIDFFDSITPTGFAFDGEGAKGKGCKTPFGNRQTFKLIQTPEKMAQYISKDEKDQWWHEKESHLPMELLNFTHLLGNNELTEQYRQKVQENLNTPYQEGLNLRHYLAKKHLVQEDMIAFDPGMGSLEKQGMLFKVKIDFYRFPHLAVDRLALLKEVVTLDTFGRIDQLNKQGILTSNAAEKLQDWMSIVLFMRLRTYFNCNAQKEAMNPLIKPFGFDDPRLIKEQLALDHKALEKIKKIYRIYIPFYHAMRDFLAGHENNLSSSDLNDDSPQTQGYIALRLFQNQEAKKWFHEALKKDSENFESLNELGLIYEQDEQEGSLKLAAKYLNQARKVALKSPRENKSFVASVYNNLISLYPTEVNFENAIDYANQALKILRELVDEDHPCIAGAYNNLGLIYHGQGNLKKAVEYYKKALKIDKKFIKEKPASVAIDYNNLAMIYLEQEDVIRAMDFVKQALNINLNFYGEMHPNVVTNYNNLAMIYQKQGELEKAMENVKKALAIDRKFFGKNHHTVATDYNNLGGIFIGLGNLKQAAEYIRKALKINLKHSGGNHRNAAENYNHLGMILRQDQGDLEKAAEYVHQAVDILIKIGDENHPSLATYYHHLGLIYQDQGDLEKAAEYVHQAVDIFIKIGDENHPHVVTYYHHLGLIYQKQGKLEKAFEHINKAIRLAYRLGQAYKKQGNLSLAIKYTKEAFRINIRLYGIHHSTTVTINANLQELNLAFSRNAGRKSSFPS